MRTWIVAAHPDDEVIGASAVLGWSREVLVVHVTDGAPRDARWWPAGVTDRAAYARQRQREADQALAGSGAARVPLGFVDLETMYALPELVRTLADLMERARPDAIVTHAYEGGHPDHDSVAFAVTAARTRIGAAVPVFEMALYHGAAGRLVVNRFVDESGDDRRSGRPRAARQARDAGGAPLAARRARAVRRGRARGVPPGAGPRLRAAAPRRPAALRAPRNGARRRVAIPRSGRPALIADARHGRCTANVLTISREL
jgi:LmbE family N-acetylglucosaminyl deacetylase